MRRNGPGLRVCHVEPFDKLRTGSAGGPCLVMLSGVETSLGRALVKRGVSREIPRLPLCSELLIKSEQLPSGAVARARVRAPIMKRLLHISPLPLGEG